MTDNEIIKALECCISSSTALACFKCPMVKNKECNGSNTNVNKLVVENALALINRQKAEIERLKEENKFHRKTITENAQRALEVTIEEIEKAKSEAYREFAERLKSVSHPYADTQIVFELQIDNLVKEMTEQKE